MMALFESYTIRQRWLSKVRAGEIVALLGQALGGGGQGQSRQGGAQAANYLSPDAMLSKMGARIQ